MPINDPNRIGPNQDINDPTTLIETGYEFNRISENLGNMLAVSNDQDLNASGPKITDIIIPLKILDGSTSDFDCEDIDKIGDDFIYDTDLWSTGTIVTYIDLAEIFRQYWNTLNNVLDQLINVDSFNTTTIDPFPSGTSGSLGGTFYERILSSFTPDSSYPEPLWSGDGPTNYNSGTYPQLIEEVLKLETEVNDIINEQVAEIYYYAKLSGQSVIPITIFDAVVFTSSSFLSLRNVLPFASLLVLQIPNFTNDALTVNYNASCSYSRSSTIAPGNDIGDNESASVSVSVKIGDYNHYDLSTELINDTDTDSNLFPLPQNTSLSASLIDSFDIPVGKSAFIEINAGSIASILLTSDNPTSFSSTESIRIFHGSEDKTVSNNHSFNYP